MSHEQADLIAWFGELVEAIEHMDSADRADLDAWDRSRAPGVRTSDWPRWTEFIRPCPTGEDAEPLPADARKHEVDPDGFYVYRLWSQDGRLIYVGCTTRPAARLRAHRRRWGHLFTSVTWERHPDAERMLEAERAAIKDEYPALNKAGV